MRRWTVLAPLLLLASAGCTQAPGPSGPGAAGPQMASAPPAESVAPPGDAGALDLTALAKAALDPFKKALREALTEAMKRGGIREAIHVCHDEAPVLAARFSVGGARMGRTSHKLRRAENTAPAWVAPILAELVAKNGGEAKTVELPEGVGYVEPIVTVALCLPCHGKRPAPEVVAELKRRYPNDQATGFEAGDLRGVYWVELRTR